MFPRPAPTAAAEPVTLSDALAHLREVSDGGTNDALVTSLIKAAREACEARTGRVLIVTPFVLTLPSWPCAGSTNPLGMIDLKVAPLVAVQSVQYLDEDGVLQILASDQYKVYTHLSTGMIGPAYGVSWPSVQGDVLDGVRVSFTAGYGPTVGFDNTVVPVPHKAREWILCALTFMYENRLEGLPEEFAPGLINDLVILGR